MIKIFKEKGEKNRRLFFANRFSRNPFKGSERILGIACTGHGASLAYVDANGVIRGSVLDRWVGVKHTLMFSADEDHEIRSCETEGDAAINRIFVEGFGKFPETRIFEECLPSWFQWLLGDLGVKPEDIDLVVTSDSHFATCWLRLGFGLDRWFPSAQISREIEHHEIHQRQAFWQSGFREAAVLTLDTCGEELERLSGKKTAGTIARMDNKGNCKILNEMLYPESSPGELYNVFNHHVGFREGEQGKTMGLAAYGKPDFFRQLEKNLDLQDNGSFTFMDTEDIKRALSDYVPARKQGEEITQEHMNAAYAGQALIELIVTNAFKAALKLSGLKDLVYAGGIALNSVANEIACEETKPQRIYIAPNPGDTGHALGCVLYGAYELAGWDPPTREIPEYLGPPYSLHEMEAAAKSSEFPYTNCDNIEHTIARCIANGCIVARFKGGAEFGPRALGNRSILCDPRRPDMKDYLNARVKHREGFRPYAPTVLEEHASKWFEVEERSSYMLRVAPVREEVRKKIPAVVHVDNSARLQTLAYHENPGYWRIIDAFYRLTGVPLVLNTSFNVAGKPIVEKPADAVECFKSTEIDILILGHFILSKGPLDHYLENSC